MRDIRPMGNHVLVRPAAVAKKSEGGIIYAEQYQQKSGEGKVISVGPGKMDYAGRMVQPQLTPGDTVMYLWIHGREVNVDGTTLHIIDADEILGVIK